MAGRDIRRKPGMTVGQRMRDFSRTVMRHYAPLPDDSAPSPASASPISLASAPVPSITAPIESPEANPQFVASPPLPFDAPAVDIPAPLLPPADLPVYAPDPPLPQYVVPSSPPAPVVQRSEQPARPVGDTAMGPDGKPLIYNGKPIPIDHDPTPPALLELMQRQRQRDAEVQRLKEERTEKLKAELPPVPEDSDAPRSSRIRRRGSAEVDYVQTKALADKREPGDNGAPPAKNIKSPRESEQPEAQALDDEEDSNGDGGESISFELPIDAASPVTQPADGFTAADTPSVQRETDFATPVPSIPFDTPIDAPAAKPDVMPDVSQPQQPFAEPSSPAPTDAPPAPSSALQRQPDSQASTTSQPVDVPRNERSVSTPAERPMLRGIPKSAVESNVPTLPVQRQAESVASEPPFPLGELNPAPHDERLTASPTTPDVPQIPQVAAVQTPPQAIQRQALPEITPSLPFDVPANQTGLPDESQVAVMPAPEMPSVQREPAHEIPVPSLPFDVPTTVDVPAIDPSDMPEISRPHVTNAPEVSSSQVSAAMPAPPAAVQRESETSTFTTDRPLDAQPVEQASMPNLGQPQIASSPDAPSQSSVAPQPSAVQRQSEPVMSIPSIPFDEPVVNETIEPQAEHSASPEASRLQSPVDSSPPTIQRQPGVKDPAPDALPFDVPSVEQASSPEFAQPEQTAAAQAPAPMDASTSRSVPIIQRQPKADTPAPVDLPLDAPSVEQVASPGFEQPSPTTEQQVPAPIDSPLSRSVQAIQRELEAEVFTPDALPFDAASVEQAASPEFSQPEPTVAPPATAATDTPTSQTSPDIQRQTEADFSVSVPRDMSAMPRPLADVSQTVTAEVTPQASIPAIQRRVETETEVLPVPFDTPRNDPAPVQEVTQHEPSIPTAQRSTETVVPTHAPSIDVTDAPLPIEQSASNEISRASSTPAQESPAIQRRAHSEAPSLLPFDATVQDSQLPESGAEYTSAPDIQTQADIAAPPIQRRVEQDASLPLPFEAPVEAQVLNAPQSAAPDTSRPASETQSGTAAQALQRQPTIDMPQATSFEPLQVQTPDVSRPEQVTVPQPSMQTSTDSTAAPAIQRQVEVEANTSPPLPFDLPRATEVVVGSQSEQAVMPEVSAADQASVANTLANTPVTAAPALQRQAEVEATIPSPLPFEKPRSTNEAIEPLVEQPVILDVPQVEQARVDTTPTNAPVTAAPAIQRQVQVETTDSPPLPFDVQPMEQSASPQIQEAAAPDITQLADASTSQTVTPTVGISPAVQRQSAAENPPSLPFDTPIADPSGEPAQTFSAEQSTVPEASPLPSQPAVPSTAQTPSVQRQADISMPAASAAKSQTTVPAALPFDDLNAIAVQRMPVEHVAQTTQPAILPFDPVAPTAPLDIQRTPESESADPFSTPGTMPAGVPATDRMDVFQALVAAGMVSRPPGGHSMPAAAPHAQPLLQRSPSREAYLANMAQRQESAGAVSGPIQRALSEETESNPSALQTETEDAPEIDINQLASDVMRVLRGKLRSEHERLSKR